MDGLAEAVMPAGPVAVTDTAPLKPLTPVNVTTVLESEPPCGIFTVPELRAELNPAGPTCNAIVFE